MILKSHLCGVAVVYEDLGSRTDKKKPDGFFTETSLKIGRPQGSLYSQQKRRIADACEYLRKNATYKPLIFTATSPGFTDLATEGKLIQKLTHNLRNGYNVKNYIWVREFTQAGYPHFHFVADTDYLDGVALSLYWSRLFGSDARNSVRLGTAPRCNKCRTPLRSKGQQCFRQGCSGMAVVKYHLDNKQMAWYMSKYIGKSIGGLETMALDDMKKTKISYAHYPDDDFYTESIIPGKSFRTFAISRELAKASEPKLYQSEWIEAREAQGFTTAGFQKLWLRDRIWKDDNETLTDKQLQKNWNWKYTGFSSTFKGYPKQWKLKQKK